MEHDSRLSVLEVIDRHLNAINAKSFVVRVIFIGKYSHNDVQNLETFYQEVIKKINSTYCDIPLSGFILLYQNYFIVVVEGSEDTIMRMIRSIVKEHEETSKIEQTKLLAVYHNVKKRFFSSWHSFHANSSEPKILNNENSFVDILKIVSDCIEKILAFTSIIVNNAEIVIMDDIEIDRLFEISSFKKIISSTSVMDLKTYCDMYLTIPEYAFSIEKCWPAPFDFTPTFAKIKSSQLKFIPSLKDIIANKHSEE